MRSPPRRRRIAGVGEPICVEVELDVVDPIKGRVREPGEPERPFLGWLQLLEVLEAVCSRVRGPNEKRPRE
jgi:hypothetical protein